MPDSVAAEEETLSMPNRPRVDWTLNLGNILQILLIAGGIGFFVITGNAKNENTAGAVTSLERRVEQGFEAMNRRVDALAAAVNLTATLTPRMTEAERRLTEQDTRDNGQDQRIGLVSEAVATLRARLEYVAQPGRRVIP